MKPARITPFAESISRRFAELPVTHRVHVLSQLLRTVGPLALGAIAEGAFTKCAARSGWQRLSVTGDDALDASPEQIRDLARYAEQAAPGVAVQLRAQMESQSAVDRARAVGGGRAPAMERPRA